MGDHRPLLPMRVRFDGRVVKKDVTPLPTVIPPVLAPKESRGTGESFFGPCRKPPRPEFAGELFLPGPSFHEKPLVDVENDA